VALGSLDIQPGHIKDPVTRQSNRGPISSMVFSNDSSMLYIGCIDGTVRVCDAQQCIPLAVMETDIGIVDHLIVCPDLDVLVMASKRNSVIEMWDLRLVDGNGDSNRPIRIKSHRRGVKTLSFSQKSNRLASGGADRTIRLWEIQRRLNLSEKALPSESSLHISGSQVITGHGHDVDMVGLASGGSRLASRSRDKTLRLWELTEDQLPKSPEFHEIQSVDGNIGSDFPSWEYGEDLHTLQFSPDGKRLICGSTIGGIQLWDASNGKKLCGVHPDTSRNERGYIARLSCLTLADFGEEHNEDLFAAGYHNSSLILFQSRYSGPSSSLSVNRLDGHKSSVHSLGISQDRTRLLSGEWDGIINIWDIKDKTTIASFNCQNAPAFLVLSAGTNPFLACASSRSLFVWDMVTGSPLHPENGLKFGQGLERADSFSLKFYSTQDQHLLAFGRERSMDVLKLIQNNTHLSIGKEVRETSEAGERLVYLYRSERAEVYGRRPVAWSADGNFVFDALNTTHISPLLNLETDVVDQNPQARGDAESVTISPFSPMLLCNTTDGIIVAQGVNGYRKLVLTLPRDTKIERWVSFDDRIALGSFDGKILLIKFPPGYVPEQQTALFAF
jgi:WD40 repeat protein